MQEGNKSGSIIRKDTTKALKIGEEIYEHHNTKIEGETKGRKRKQKLDDCYEAASRKHNIAVQTAENYYKAYKKYRKDMNL